MVKILFICHGNICRSTMAEFVFKDMVAKQGLTDEFYIASAATSSEEIGNPVHHGTREKLLEHGITCEGKRAVRLKKDDYNQYDYLIGMDGRNLVNMQKILGQDTDGKMSMLLDFTEDKGRDIADPWYTGNFEQTYQDVKKGCDNLLSLILEGIV